MLEGRTAFLRTQDIRLNRVLFPARAYRFIVRMYLEKMAAEARQLRLETILFRSFWAAILLVHLWPLVKVIGFLLAQPDNPAAWGSLLALLVAIAFFSAKTAGVRWLQLPSRWTGAVVFLVACGLVHGERVDPHDPLKITTVAVVATTAATVLAIRQRRRLGELLTNLAGAPALTIHQLCLWGERAGRSGWIRDHLLTIGHPRGPPVLNGC
jgi:hypothetical protein